MNEWKLIQNFKRLIPRNLQGDLGIGDDADLISLKGSKIVCASDVIVENVDFKFTQAKPEQVGHKALAVNLSDLAAMGAKPLGFLISLGLPPKIKPEWVSKFYRGMISLAKQYQIKCLGGDLSSSNEIFISITALGVPFSQRVITRSGAKKGDLIAVTGKLGGSIRGHHLNFSPRIKESEFLAKNFKISSMIDISDGFAQDLEHLLKSSNVGAAIDLEAIPVSQEAKNLHGALSDGEDFELLFTLDRRQKNKLQQFWKKRFSKVKLSFVGKIIPGKSIRWSDKNFTLSKKGYSHEF